MAHLIGLLGLVFFNHGQKKSYIACFYPDLVPGVRMRSGMRMRTHRMREILRNADKDANAFDEQWEWMRMRILAKAFASMLFCFDLVLNL